MTTWRAFWMRLCRLPLTLWRIPARQMRLEVITQRLMSQSQQLQAQSGQLLAQIDLLHQQSNAVHHAIQAWLPPEDLPFSLHRPGANWLPKAEARLGQVASSLTPERRAASFYTYYSEMAGDTRPILHQQYEAYWPLLLQVRQSTESQPETPWLDIGCGAGEFLHFLAGHGWPAEGIDMRATEVARCQAQGLSVSEADALTHLRALHDAGAAHQFSGISLFQVIEHLPPADVLPLLNLCIQSLMPGGMLLVETINLRHPLAFSSFYTDPTHQTPLPDNYLAFVLQWLGLAQVGVLYTLPSPVALLPQAEQTAQYFNYAVYGYRASDPP